MTLDELRLTALDPPAGSALQRARDYGLDLTLLVRNASLGGEQRFEKAGRALEMARELQRLKALRTS